VPALASAGRIYGDVEDCCWSAKTSLARQGPAPVSVASEYQAADRGRKIGKLAKHVRAKNSMPSSVLSKTCSMPAEVAVARHAASLATTRPHRDGDAAPSSPRTARRWARPARFLLDGRVINACAPLWRVGQAEHRHGGKLRAACEGSPTIANSRMPSARAV